MIHYYEIKKMIPIQLYVEYLVIQFNIVKKNKPVLKISFCFFEKLIIYFKGETTLTRLLNGNSGQNDIQNVTIPPQHIQSKVKN